MLQQLRAQDALALAQRTQELHSARSEAEALRARVQACGTPPTRRF